MSAVGFGPVAGEIPVISSGPPPAAGAALADKAREITEQAHALGPLATGAERQQQQRLAAEALALREQAHAAPPAPPPAPEPGAGFPLIGWPRVPGDDDETHIGRLQVMQAGAAEYGLDLLGEDRAAMRALEQGVRYGVQDVERGRVEQRQAESMKLLERALGEQTAPTIEAARAAVAKFGEDFADYLDATGAGNDPVLIRELASLARRKGWAR